MNHRPDGAGGDDDRARLSRRDLLRGSARRRGLAARTGAARDAAPIPVPGTEPPRAADPPSPRSTIPVHRPPGAIDEVGFLARCTRCGDCIRACPVHAIVPAPPRYREAAGTPMIDPSVSPCVMCEGTPCIDACEPAVLRRDLPLAMARATIMKPSCLAWNGSFCSVCAERCPVPGAIAVESGRPRIVESQCTGCGVCAFVCPAPGSAVIIMPLADRPSAPEARG